MEPAAPDATAALSVRGVSKVFQGTPALQDVDLDLWSGEIHALLGHNGSGKSTLIKALAGYHRPEPGATATRNGQPFHLGSAAAAHVAGLRFIHQDPAVIGDLDVADNLALGESYTRRWWLSDRRERREAAEVFRSFGIEVDPSSPLRALGSAQRTITAIIRALHHGTRDGILVLDEPTATLSEQESDLLFALMRRVRDQGAALLYVTHRLDEVVRLADRVTVLRDGRRIVTRPAADLTREDLVELIVGDVPQAGDVARSATHGDVVLDVDTLDGLGVDEVSLQVHRGEVVGVTGLLGSGVERLLPLVFGAEPRAGGRVRVGGVDVKANSPKQAIAAGVAFAPADRTALGAIPAWTLRENLTLPRLRPLSAIRWLSERSEAAETRQWLDRLHVSPAQPDATFSSLSGGNQQKVVLAKWFRCEAQVLLLEEPTAGVDVGAAAAIYIAIAKAVAAGAGALIASSDSEELASVCDRVLVMRNGRIATVLEGTACTVSRIVAESVRTDSDHRETAAA